MTNELLLLPKTHTDMLFQQTKTRPQEALEVKLPHLTIAFSFSPPINLAGEAKLLLAVTSFELTNSVLSITDGSIIFSMTMPGPWTRYDGKDNIIRLSNLIGLRSQNDIELHVKEVDKRGLGLEILETKPKR